MKTTKTLKIEGMSCKHCAMAVEQALAGIEGVEKASVNLEKKTAEVTFDSGKTGIPAMIKAVEDEGFGAAE